MKIQTVLCLAEEHDLPFYESLTWPDEIVEGCSLGIGGERIKQENFDLVIFDCDSDACGNLAVIADIKEKIPGLPVILVVGKSSEEQVLKAFRAGVRDYFKKPVCAMDLQRTARALLNSCRANTEKRCHIGKIDGKDQERECQPPPNIRGAIRHIEKNITKPLKLQEIAQVAHLSKFHFCRQFKKYKGMSPFQYHAEIRIARAKNLLWKTQRNISLIAFEVGFHTLSEFSKQFKRSTGLTPSAYRKSLK